MRMKGKPPQPKISSSDDLLAALEALIAKSSQSSKKAADPAPAIVSMLSSLREPFSAADGAIPRVAATVARSDTSWTTRLQLAFRLRTGKIEFQRRLALHLRQEARRATAYPSAEQEMEWSDIADWLTRSLKTDEKSETSKLPPAALLTAMLPNAELPIFPDAVAMLLDLAVERRATRDPSAEFVVSAVDLFKRSSPGMKSAAPILHLLQPFLVRAREAATRENRLKSEITKEKTAVDQLTVKVEELSQELRGSRERANKLQARVSELEAQLQADRNTFEVRRNEDRIRAETELDRLRTQVRNTIVQGTTEIKLYLERGSPNVEDALARVEILERFSRSLEHERL